MRAEIRECLNLRKSLINRPYYIEKHGRKALRKRSYSIERHGVPPEWKRVDILMRLLKARHFDGIWYNGVTLSVRKVPGIQPPEYLSWGDAVKILQQLERDHHQQIPAHGVA